jgi:hypothetical protein
VEGQKKFDILPKPRMILAELIQGLAPLLPLQAINCDEDLGQPMMMLNGVHIPDPAATGGSCLSSRPTLSYATSLKFRRQGNRG